jgi:uncharacterized protein YcbX
MPLKIGEVAALYRYPVKSMRGERIEVADLIWGAICVWARLRRRADSVYSPV